MYLSTILPPKTKIFNIKGVFSFKNQQRILSNKILLPQVKHHFGVIKYRFCCTLLIANILDKNRSQIIYKKFIMCLSKYAQQKSCNGISERSKM